MCSGCDRIHHLEALRRAALIVVIGALVAGAGAARAAETQKLAPDGTLHKVTVENWPATGKPTGTALRHTRQTAAGVTDSALIPGTDDAAIDRDVALGIDPLSGQPVVAWSRNEGAGFDIFVSRYESGSWRTPRRVVRTSGDQTRPELHIASTLVHVMWKQLSQSQPGYVRASLDRVTLDLVFGPEMLPIADAVSGASDSPSPFPARSDAFFAAEAPPRWPGDSGRIVIWGVRDAPIPVDFSQAFLLPGDVRNVLSPTAHWVADRFVLHFLLSDRFLYALRTDASWTPLEMILLGPDTQASDAQMQMEDMIRRGVTHLD